MFAQGITDPTCTVCNMFGLNASRLKEVRSLNNLVLSQGSVHTSHTSSMRAVNIKQRQITIRSEWSARAWIERSGAGSLSVGRGSSASVDRLSTAHCLKDFQLCPSSLSTWKSRPSPHRCGFVTKCKSSAAQNAASEKKKSTSLTPTRDTTFHSLHPDGDMPPSSSKECVFSRRLCP